MYVGLFKRIIDLTFALLLMIALAPVFLIVTVVNSLVNRGSIFFVQKRIGRNEKEFKLYKFKTLLEPASGKSRFFEDPVTHRTMTMTGWGQFLRACSLDEIPQLVNVVLNDLSLVGPRPLLPEYINYYLPEERKRHMVKPGITGLAQVSGRKMLDWPQKLAFDVEYTENVSFLLDLRILALTVLQWFRPQEPKSEISLIDYRMQSGQKAKIK